jgi:hypothetical protein
VVAGESGLHRFDHRGEGCTTGGLALAFHTLGLGDLLEQDFRATKTLLGAGQDDAAPAVAQPHHDA